MKTVAALAAAAISAVALTGCWAFPHSTSTLWVCGEYGWSSNVCGIFLCDDWSTFYDWPSSACPAEIRWGTEPR